MAKKKLVPSNWTDPDDAPPLDRDWFQRAEIRDGRSLVRAAWSRQHDRRHTPLDGL